MKKRNLLLFILFLIGFQAVSGQSKIAVLDASIGKGVEDNASAIVADTINEQFVKSKDYIAIDRAYISKIQAEKKFQLSGEVNSADVKELGALFGAQFICIANVSKLGSTYTVSARMIDVATAQIISQESAKQKGEIDVLFDLAEIVGEKLVGKSRKTESGPAVQEKKPEPEAAEKTVIPVTKRRTRPRFTVGYMFAGYFGNDNNPAIYEQDTYLESITYPFTDVSTFAYGVDLEVIIPSNKYYFSAGFTFTDQIVEASDGYNNYVGDYFTWDNLYTGELYIGGGSVFKLGKRLQAFIGLNVGVMTLTLGSDYDDDATGSIWGTSGGETASGFSYGIEMGADYFFGSFCMSAKFKLSYSGDLTGDNIFTDSAVDSLGYDSSFGTSGFIISTGYSW